MTDVSEMRIGCAMTGSFCTFKAVFSAWRTLKATGAALTPIMSFNASTVDTRFCAAEEAVKELKARGADLGAWTMLEDRPPEGLQRVENEQQTE